MAEVGTRTVAQVGLAWSTDFNVIYSPSFCSHHALDSNATGWISVRVRPFLETDPVWCFCYNNRKEEDRAQSMLGRTLSAIRLHCHNNHYTFQLKINCCFECMPQLLCNQDNCLTMMTIVMLSSAAQNLVQQKSESIVHNQEGICRWEVTHRSISWSWKRQARLTMFRQPEQSGHLPNPIQWKGLGKRVVQLLARVRVYKISGSLESLRE